VKGLLTISWGWGRVQAVVTTRGKESKEAKKLTAATRRHMKKSRAIAMLGFALEAVAEGRAVLRLDTRAHHKQLNKVVHGGILAAMADTASAIAAYTAVPAGVALATVELKINYLEGVPGGRIRAEARVLRTGRNFVVTECEIFDKKGTLAAKALLTFGAAGGHSLQK
jgi:uncharacterized protein (TIGR00369 family)